MMKINHPSLFEPHKLARRADPETSKAAARACQSIRAGLTSDEIAQRLGVQKVQVARRMGELVADGYVRTTGETRPTPSGRAAQCYAIVEAGR